MADSLSHYFSQCISPSRRRRDSGFPKTFAADGGARPISGGTPFRQPCPASSFHYARKASQVRFSEECFRIHLLFENALLNSLAADPPLNAENPQRTASLDELAEPNYYSKRFETSSTHVFASQDTGTGTVAMCAAVVSTATPRQSKDPSQRTLGISAAGSRFAHARKAPQLADSVSILYTTSFPIH
jgi:hypothetical protein